MFTASHTTSKVTLRARVATQPRRVSRANRHSRSRNAAVGIDDITGPINDTIKEVQSIGGAKDVVQRLGLYGAPLVFSASALQALHFGGAGNAAAMKAAGLAGPAGPLAPLAAIMLFSAASPYINFLMASAGVFKIGDEIPRLYCGVLYVVAAIGIWHFGSAGATDIWTRHWTVWHLALGAHLLTATNKIRNVLGSSMCDGIRKVATVGPAMLMAALICQNSTWTAWQAASSGPHGPLAVLLIHPLHKYVSLGACFAYLTGAETKFSSVFIALTYFIAAASFMPPLVAPLCYIGILMNLHNGMALWRETTPKDSLIPAL